MSKKEKGGENPQQQPAPTTETGALIISTNTATGEQMTMVPDEMMKQVESIKTRLKSMTPGLEITSEYKDFERGDKVKCVFISLTSIKGMNGKDVPAAKFIDEDGKLIITANAVIVGSCQELVPPMPLMLECTGEKTAAHGIGKYKTFKVSLLK